MKSDELVHLRPVCPADYEYAMLLAGSQDSGILWKFRGATPSPEVLARCMHDGFYCHYVVVDAFGERSGFVGLYNVNLASGFGFLHALSVPRTRQALVTLRGTFGVLDFGFETLGLQKVYFEGPELTAKAIGLGNWSEFLEEEGRLREHEILLGKRVDFVTYALYKEKWELARSIFTR